MKSRLACAVLTAPFFLLPVGLYSRWYVNSVLCAVIGAAASAFTSIAAGYAFDKYSFRHKEKLFGLVLTAMTAGAVK